MPRTALRPLTLVGVLALVAVVVGAQAPAARDADELTARIVVQLLEGGHMAKPKINDEIAKKWCKTFIKDLDPQKNYFLKADVDEFMAQADTLDDKIRTGNHKDQNFNVVDKSGRHVMSDQLANTLRVNRDGTQFEIIADRQTQPDIAA